MKAMVRKKGVRTPTAWKAAAGLLRTKKQKINRELQRNRTNWAARLKKLSSL